MTTPPKPQPTDTIHRVIRGGSWLNSSTLLVRGAYCIGNTPLARSDNIGFRTTQTGCRQILKGGVTR